MTEKLIKRLSDLGYTYDETKDEGLLTFTLGAVENQIKNRINASVIPAELLEVEIDMVCGEFLKLKKSTKQLTEFHFEQAIASIKEGDTTVTFLNGASPEQQFDMLLNLMINGHEADFIRHRKLVW